MSLATRMTRFSVKPATVLLAAIVLAGCAQQSTPGYYTAPAASTETDALQQAQGRTGTLAPSQVQIGFGPVEEEVKVTAQVVPEGQAPVASSPVLKADIPRPLREPRTFLGTIPCLTDGGNCSVQRMTITLAPTGEWRARTEFLGDASRTNLVQQGCWNVTSNTPLRIMLQIPEGATRGVFSFVNDNVMRVVALDDVSPSLDTRLSRQADIDPISELPTAPLACR